MKWKRFYIVTDGKYDNSATALQSRHAGHSREARRVYRCRKTTHKVELRLDKLFQHAELVETYPVPTLTLQTTSSEPMGNYTVRES